MWQTQINAFITRRVSAFGLIQNLKLVYIVSVGVNLTTNCLSYTQHLRVWSNCKQYNPSCSFGEPRNVLPLMEYSWPPLWSSGQNSWLITEMYCFLWGTNWIYICYVEESRPPLWSSGQNSWVQNREVLFPVRYELNLYMLCTRK
jgi:hypothetical protein